MMDRGERKKDKVLKTTTIWFSTPYLLSGIRESNPPPRLGKPVHYRCANPAQIVQKRATSGTRTRDPRITNALLYQLSHHGFSFQSDCKGNEIFLIDEIIHYP